MVMLSHYVVDVGHVLGQIAGLQSRAALSTLALELAGPG